MMDDHRGLARAGKAGGWAATIALMVLLAEVVWMVLPFVGYVSLHVTMDPFFRFRGRWFQPFFMRSYHPAGAPLALVGMGFFLAGATQIYGSKLRGGGAVTGGLYRWVRHPQYASLAVVGLGLLLLWPRYYLLLAFVTMCFLYVALARAEERRMLALAGEPYRLYLARTSMFFPGERRIVKIGPPRSATRGTVLRGVGLWLLSSLVAFTAGLGLSALTILHRPVPVVVAHGMVALDRRIVREGTIRRGEDILEFFGRDALERRIRRDERTRERLAESLRILSEDAAVCRLLAAIEGPATLMAMPWEPDRPLLDGEKPAPRDSEHLLRVYVVAAAARGNTELPPERAFDGYLHDKVVKLLVSTMVDLDAGRVVGVAPHAARRRFITTWDRVLDKVTF